MEITPEQYDKTQNKENSPDKLVGGQVEAKSTAETHYGRTLGNLNRSKIK